MNKQYAEEILSGLDAASKTRLSMYRKNLSTDKDPKVFDDNLRDYILKVAKPEGLDIIEDVVSYCDSVEYNQSMYRAQMLREQVERFSEPSVPWFGWNRHYKTAKEKLMREVSEWNLFVLNFGGNIDIENCLPRTDTHAGFSYLTTGLKQKGEYRDGLLQNYLSETTRAKLVGSFNKPILIGSRTQSPPPFDSLTGVRIFLTHEEMDGKKKTRLVSMIDIYQILAECVFARPFQERMSTTSWYAGGKSDSKISDSVYKARRKFKKWISLDYSSYDQTISDWMIRDAFDVVRVAFQGINYDEELFKLVREDFINKVFITADGVMESKRGVPSGSMFTQIIDSIVNRLMIDTYMMSRGITDYEMLIMGDDNLIFYNDDVDADELVHSISTYLLRNFGVIMNPDKVDKGDSAKNDPHFLSRYWTALGVWRSPEVLISKMTRPERFRDYKRTEIKPSIIVQAYIETFPLGMLKFINMEKHIALCREEQGSVEDGRWLSGLMAYRQLYTDEAS